MKHQIKIAIAEDHLIFRQGLIKMFEDYDDIKVIFHVSNGKELLYELKKFTPDIILLDIGMPIMPGNVAMEKIIIKYPQIKIIVLSQFIDESYILEFIELGASSFLVKHTDIERVVEAIYSVYDKGRYFDARVSAIMANHISSKAKTSSSQGINGVNLTDREHEILQHLVSGKTAKDIGEELFISAKTVENHKASLLRKTNCNNTVALIQYAHLHNLI